MEGPREDRRTRCFLLFEQQTDMIVGGFTGEGDVGTIL